MTEQEWLTSDDPAKMLKYLNEVTGSVYGYSVERGRKPSDRKLRMFACALRRQVPGLIWAGESAGWSHMEDHPEDPVLAGKYPAHRIPAIEHAQLFLSEHIGGRPSGKAASDTLRDIVGNPFRTVKLPMYGHFTPEGRLKIRSNRCPWFTPQVVSLAQAAYGQRQADGTLDTARLGILSDALEEAGCDNESLLGHLRGRQWCPVCDGKAGEYSYPADDPLNKRLEGEHWHACHGCGGKGVLTPAAHYRGCWALDLILGRE